MPHSVEFAPRIKETIAAVTLAAFALTACGPDYEYKHADSDEEKAEMRDEANDQIRVEQTAVLEEDGLLGRHDLAIMQPNSTEHPYSQASGDIKGDGFGLFFLPIGGGKADVDGHVESESGVKVEQYVRLAWKANTEQGVITTTDFPIDIVRVIEVGADEKAQVEFNVRQDSLIDFVEDGEIGCIEDDEPKDNVVMKHYRPEWCTNTTRYTNLNDYLRHEGYIDTINLYLPPQNASQYFAQVAQL